MPPAPGSAPLPRSLQRHALHFHLHCHVRASPAIALRSASSLCEEMRIGHSMSDPLRSSTFMLSLCCLALSSRDSFFFSNLINCSKNAGVSGSGSESFPLSTSAWSPATRDESSASQPVGIPFGCAPKNRALLVPRRCPALRNNPHPSMHTPEASSSSRSASKRCSAAAAHTTTRTCRHLNQPDRASQRSERRRSSSFLT